jgi:hypothetical protein
VVAILIYNDRIAQFLRAGMPLPTTLTAKFATPLGEFCGLFYKIRVGGRIPSFSIDAAQDLALFVCGDAIPFPVVGEYDQTRAMVRDRRPITAAPEWLTSRILKEIAQPIANVRLA